MQKSEDIDWWLTDWLIDIESAGMRAVTQCAQKKWEKMQKEYKEKRQKECSKKKKRKSEVQRERKWEESARVKGG